MRTPPEDCDDREALYDDPNVLSLLTASPTFLKRSAALPKVARGPLAHAPLAEETEKLVVVLEPWKPKPPTQLQWQVCRGLHSPFPFEIYRAVVQLDEEWRCALISLRKGRSGSN